MSKTKTAEHIKDVVKPEQDNAKLRELCGFVLYVFVCLLLGGSALVGAIFGAGFGFAALFILTACWLLASLWAYGKSIKAGDDHDRD